MPSGDGSGVLDCAGLSVAYPGRTAVEALDVRFGAGVTMVMGPNGAGKSSLLGVLAGLRKPTAGSVRLDGRGPTDRSWHRRVGYLPQEPELAGGVDVEDTVLLAAWLKGVPRHELRPAARRALAQVGLADRGRDRVRTLSGGMRRRLGFATAVVHRPELLLLDEPTAGLDPEQRAGLAAVVRGVADGRIVVISTHLADDVRLFADGVAVLAAGRLAFHGSLPELAAGAGRRLGRELDPARAGDLDLAYLSYAGGGSAS